MRSPGSRSSWTTSRSSAWRKRVAAVLARRAPGARRPPRAAASRSVAPSSPPASHSRSWSSVAGDGQQPQQLLGVVGQALDAQHERVAQRRRHLAAPVEPGGEQLLGEQRVALAARPQAVDEVVAGRVAEDVGELLGELRARQRAEVDAPRARAALELGEQRAQRVAAVQLVGAVGGDEQHALAGQAARQEDQARARRAVGPVQVLDDEQHRRLARRARAAASSSASNRRACGGARRARRRRRARAGPSPGRSPASSARAEGGSSSSAGSPVAGERAQGADDRRVGQLALAELDALAARARATPRSRGAASELGQISRLLPTPDSPATKASDGCEAAASASAASSSASSDVRPISRLEIMRVATLGVWLGIDRCGRGREVDADVAVHGVLSGFGPGRHESMVDCDRSPAHRAHGAS